MNCRGCGLENPPVQEACAFCEEPLKPGERAAEWERLGPALREEFSKKFVEALERRRAWLAGHRRRRAAHVALGGVLLAVLAALTHGPTGPSVGPLWILMDAALGVAAGYLLHQARGGEYQGLLAFGGSYAVSTFVKLACGSLKVSLLFGFFVLPGFLASLCWGYLFGMGMSLRRSIEE